MAIDLTWKINGTDLGSLGAIATGTLWRPGISAQQLDVPIPGMHGSLWPDGPPIFEMPKLTIKIIQAGYATAAALETAARPLINLCSMPNRIVTRTVGGVDSSTRAKLVSIEWPSFGPFGVDGTIVFNLPDVFFTEALVTTATYAAGSVTFAELAGSTAPISGVVRITGPITNPTLTDAASGTSVQWGGTVAAGQYLYIDLAKWTARTSSGASDWTSGGTVATSTLSYGAGGWLQLWPSFVGPQANSTVKATLTGSSTTSATGVAVRAARTYF